METIYDNISLKELKEIMKENPREFSLVKVGWFDGWRYALYTKKGGYRVNVQKRSGQYAVTY
jgi:hypothetical protein